jgi:hypothetical protein
MHSSSDGVGLCRVGSLAATYGEKARRQNQEPINLNSTNDTDSQADQPVHALQARWNVSCCEMPTI